MKLRCVRDEPDGDNSYTMVLCFQQKAHVKNIASRFGAQNEVSACDCNSRKRKHFVPAWRWVETSRSLARRVQLFIETGSDEAWARIQTEIRLNRWVPMKRTATHQRVESK